MCTLLVASGCGRDDGNNDPDPPSQDMSVESDMFMDPDQGDPPEADMGGGEDMTSPEDMAMARACTPDPELVEARLTCQTDDTCPCGTFCDLGVCEAECSQDADCADGEVCDTYGKCRVPEAADRITLPSANELGLVEPVQTSQVLPDVDSTQVVFRVVSATDRARAMGANGVEVRCPDAQEFARVSARWRLPSGR